MLLQMALADSYSIAFEFVEDSADRPNTLTEFYQHPKYKDMKPGCYTDDTQRALANALMVLEYGKYQNNRTHAALFNPIAYVTAYQNIFRQDPRPGYSRRFEAFLKENLDTPASQMASKIKRRSTNGAVMDAAPLGFLKDLNDVKLAAAAQALSTHSHKTIPYAQIVALSAHYCIHNLGRIPELSDWLVTNMRESDPELEEIIDRATYPASPQRLPKRADMEAQTAVEVMLWALPRERSLSDLIKLAVDIGGDTDSTAAIITAVASEHYIYQDDLPEALIEGMENGPKGRDYLASIDDELHKIFTEDTSSILR